MTAITPLSAALLLAVVTPGVWAGTPPAATAFLPDFAIVLPADSPVTARLIVPPPDAMTAKKLGWTDVAFAVGPNDALWFGHDADTVVNLSARYSFRMDRPFTDIAVLPGGGFLVAGRTDLGFVPPAGISPGRGRPAAASVQPILALPVDDCRLSVGEQGTLYLWGTGRDGGKEEVHVLQPEAIASGPGEGSAIRAIRKIYASTEKISAVAGDADGVLIATGRLIVTLTVAGDGLAPVFRHPREEIADLAWSRAHGLFYATPSGVGYVGPRGAVQFIRAPNTAIRIAGGALYVFLRNSLAVVKIERLDALASLPLSRTAP